MKHINERQQQRSFVERMRAKSHAFNAPSYNTISLLPKFFRPDSNSWQRFDQDMTSFNTDQGQEAGLDVKVDVPEDTPPHRNRPSPYIPSRRSSLSVISRIISPVNFVKRSKTFRKDTRAQSLTEFDYPRVDVNELKYFDKETKHFVTGTAISIPEETSKNTAEGNSITGAMSKEAEWKSYMKDLEQGKLADGFFDECKNRMRISWEIFTGETTAHGYKRTMAAHRSRFGRLLWMLAILGVTSIVMALLYNTVVDQDLYAFSSSIKSQPHVQMVFPAVTVCNLAPYDYSRIQETSLTNYTEAMKNFLNAVSDLNSFNFTQDDNDTLILFNSTDTKYLHDQVGWKLDDFLKECYWDERSIACSKLFVQSMTIMDSCYTFNFDPSNLKVTERVGSLSGLSLLINVGNGKLGSHKTRVASGLKILLHEPNEFPNTRENAMLVSPDTTTYISVRKMEYIFLPEPYKAYGTEHCSDTIVHDARYYNYTGYSSCVATCRLKAVVDKCGCVVYGRDPDIHDVPYCTMLQYIECYIPALRETYMQTAYQMTNCACPLPCRKVEYLTQVSNSAFSRTVEGVKFLDQAAKAATANGKKNTDNVRNYVEVKIFYKELFTHIEEHIPLYTWLTIFGNVGGQMGLFTGASVLTVLEFLELFALFLWLFCHTTYRYFKNGWSSKTVDLNQHQKSETGQL